MIRLRELRSRFSFGAPLAAFVAFVALLLLALGANGPAASAAAAVAEPEQSGVIAYSTGSSVRLVDADGGNDRLLWSSPQPVENGISSIEWNYSGSEIAFVSSHEAAVSIYERDIYGIAPDGSALRKLTNAPRHDALAALPKGTVTVDVQVLNAGGGPYLIYLSGAPEAQTVSGATGVSRLTFENVADFGSTLQPAVAIEGHYRWFNAAAADVLPGQTVHAGTLTISGDGFWHFGVHENKLTWRSDDARLGFIFGAGCQIRQTDAPPAWGMQDRPLLEPAVSGTTCLVDWAPTAARAGELLYTESDFFSGEGHIYLTEEGSTAAGDPIINYPLPATVLDLEWLPDGSGFVFSYMDGANSSANLLAYYWGDSDVTPLTSFSDQFAARFSISPDGQHIVFERAQDVAGSVDLWTMAIDGSEMQLLVSNAGRPAWGAPASAPPPPPPPGDEAIYLPVVGWR